MSVTKSSSAIRATRVFACVTTVALAILVLASVSARADEAFDRFKLWTECQPMQLVVEGLHDDAKKADLTEDLIETAVRSRLRAARLYTTDLLSPHQYLYVRVNVLNFAFSTKIEFYKFLTDPRNNETGFAVTWDRGHIGTHGEDANYILGIVSQNVDTFIDEYLRVNESACSG